MTDSSDTIVVSSSDEESPPRKKVKSIFMGNMEGISLTPLPKVEQHKSEEKSAYVCVISDEDDSITEVFEVPQTIIRKDIKENSESNHGDKKKVEQNLDSKSVVDGEKRNHVQNFESIEIIDSFENAEENEDICMIIDEPENNSKHEENTNKIDGTNEDNINKKDNVTFDDTKERTIISDSNIDYSCFKSNGESSLNTDVFTPDILINKMPLVSNLESSNDNDCFKEFSNSNFMVKFVEICERILENTEYDISKNIEKLRQYYKKCEPKLVGCQDFKKLMENNIKRAQLSPAQAVISFGEVFMHVKDLFAVDTVEVTKKNKIKLKKLENTIRILVNKIKELEDAEIDFSDEENSSYIQLERFINRLNKVYRKYCEYLKSNPFSGRITYSKLNFVDSNYNEINRAISKKYRDNKKFPSFYEMETFIRNVTTENNLELTDTEIETESKHCFRKLGELLQTRRKRELYETHCLYLQDNNDPANSNSSLKIKLQSNFNRAQEEIERLCQEYVTKQDRGEEPEGSGTNKTDSNDNESEDTS